VPSWLTCVRAAEEKKSSDIRVLDLRPATSFTDFFVLCNGNNQRQCQAICDEVESAMLQRGERAISIEGYDNAEWILLDYGDLVVHVFTPHTRSFYDLERLWRDATPVAIPAP
jgi:ribosome-associated protein